MPEIGDVRAVANDVDYKPRDCYNSKGSTKQKFLSRKEAKRALKQLPKRVNGVDMRTNAVVYKCRVCNCFHIGHAR